MKPSRKRNKFKKHTARYGRRKHQPSYRVANRKDLVPRRFRYDEIEGFHFSSGVDADKTEQDNNIIQARPSRALPTWWVHFWSGLVRDPTSKHHRALRQAVWLYLYLLIAANRKTGTSMRRISTIAAETGFNRRSIHRWLKTLRKKGYIHTRSNGRALQISITKWRPISRKGKS